MHSFNPALRKHLIRASIVTVAALALAGMSTYVSGQAQSRPENWHQWGGPQRNFNVESAPIAGTWPAGGPRQLWRRPLGEGYSSILVDGSTLVTMYRRGNSEAVVALDAGSGRTLWEHLYEAPLTRDGYFDVWFNAAGPGPYSTPLIADGMVFAVGVTGKFHALDLKTGAVRWSKDLVAVLHAEGLQRLRIEPDRLQERRDSTARRQQPGCGCVQTRQRRGRMAQRGTSARTGIADSRRARWPARAGRLGAGRDRGAQSGRRGDAVAPSASDPDGPQRQHAIVGAGPAAVHFLRVRRRQPHDPPLASQRTHQPGRSVVQQPHAIALRIGDPSRQSRHRLERRLRAGVHGRAEYRDGRRGVAGA